MSNEPTIEAMNKAITEFMQLETDNESYLTPGRTRTVYLINGIWIPLRKLKYHSSWDWLMPVIEKISKIPLLNWDNTTCTDPQDVCWPRTFGMPTEDGKNVMVRFNGFSLHTAPTLIEAAHMAVYEVAEYHNKQQANEQA